MVIIDDQNFVGQSVELDGKSFRNCTFNDCILEYHGGAVAFDRSEMKGCRHVFFGRARRTLQYLQGVGLMQYTPSEWGEFPDVVH